MTTFPVALRALADLSHDPRNARTHDDAQIEQIAASIIEFGFTAPVAADRDGIVRAGNGRLDAVALIYGRGGQIKAPDGTLIPVGMIPAIDCSSWTEDQCRAYALADNRIALNAGWNQAVLDAEIAALAGMDFDLSLTGFDADEIEASMKRMAQGLEPEAETGSAIPRGAGSLSREFLIPPFSVLSAREGWWQERKKAWLALGIASEVGRGDNLLRFSDTLLEPDPDKRAALKEAAPVVKGNGWANGGPARRDVKFYEKKRQWEADNGRKISTTEFREKHWDGGERKPGEVPGGLVYGAMNMADGSERTITGTSIFDPVLCEIAYRWFSQRGGTVLDPFAGGSVRGVVAGALGRRYVGIDLRDEQIEANREQWVEISAAIEAEASGPGWAGDEISDPEALTPIERRGDIWVKRDDLFNVGGAGGGKVRSCLALAKAAKDAGAQGIVTAGSRSSPQVNIVARVAAHIGIGARCHCPSGELAPEVLAAVEAGAEIIQHQAGRNSVIVARAREDAEQSGWAEIPFGMECDEAVAQTRKQVRDIPEGVARIVCPVGSGMSLSGLLWGLIDQGLDIPVAGIVVGADPIKRLDRYAPPNWRDMVELIPSGSDYHDEAADAGVEGLRLDPHYEGKCVPFLEADDLLWVVGIRQSAKVADPNGLIDPAGMVAPDWRAGDSDQLLPLSIEGEQEFADLVFSCPPYGDLEVYSDRDGDISNLPGDEFDKSYASIIAKAVACLKPNRFACFVIGDYRDKDGLYRNLPGKTIEAFEAAGASLYNEAILVTATGTLAIRAGKSFRTTRKLGKTHQNVLVFVKGDPRLAVADLGQVDISAAPDISEAVLAENEIPSATE